MKFLSKSGTPTIAIALISLLVNACNFTTKHNAEMAYELKAKNICSERLVLDAHIDWPSRLLYRPSNINEKNTIGDFDVVRAKEGGLNAVFSVVWVDPELNLEEGRFMVDSLIGIVNNNIKLHPDKYARAADPSGLKNNFENGLLSLPLCLENGSPIGEDLEYVNYLKKHNFAYITLCHSKSNQFSDSSFDTNRIWNGLSSLGYELIDEMNRQGIMVDISHSSDSATFQAIRHSKAPVVATHSSARHFVPGFERNVSDTLIRLIAEKKGVIMVNFGSGFIDSVCFNAWDSLWHVSHEQEINLFSEEGKAMINNVQETQQVFSNASRIADHIDHIVNLVGIEYVGLGSDYDGIGPSQPTNMRDVSAYPTLVAELLRRGYTEAELEKILSGNFLRVWQETLEIGEQLTMQAKI